MRMIRLAAAFAVVAGAAVATAGVPGSVAAESKQPLQPAIGQYYATIREPAGLAGYTAYRPIGTPKHRELPVIVWGNGGCRDSNEEFQTFLGQVAAHGFYVIAVGAMESRYRPAGGPDSSPTALTRAIDWVTERSGKHGGDIRRTLDTSKIAVMGQSCGGIQALSAGGDKRVKSVASWNGASRVPTSDPAVLNALHTPTLWVTGGSTDPATTISRTDYAGVPSSVPAALIDNSAAGHTGIFHGNNDPAAARAGAPGLGQEIEVQGSTLAVQWLDYTLNGNQEAKNYFLGPNCGLCGEAYWTVQSKNFR